MRKSQVKIYEKIFRFNFKFISRTCWFQYLNFLLRKKFAYFNETQAKKKQRKGFISIRLSFGLLSWFFLLKQQKAIRFSEVREAYSYLHFSITVSLGSFFKFCFYFTQSYWKWIIFKEISYLTSPWKPNIYKHSGSEWTRE